MGKKSGPLAFLNKKTWHPGRIQNLEEVWKRQQEASKEEQKLKEYAKQLQEERAREELMSVAEVAGHKIKADRLDWMYQGGLVARQEADQRIAAQEAAQEATDGAAAGGAQNPSESVPLGGSPPAPRLPSFYSEDTPASANEMWQRLHSDPLFAIKQQELAARCNIVANPVKMMQIKQQIEELKQLAGSKKEKKRKKERHRKKKKSKRDRSLSSGSDPQAAAVAPKQQRSASPPRHAAAAAAGRPEPTSQQQQQQLWELPPREQQGGEYGDGGRRYDEGRRYNGGRQPGSRENERRPGGGRWERIRSRSRDRGGGGGGDRYGRDREREQERCGRDRLDGGRARDYRRRLHSRSRDRSRDHAARCQEDDRRRDSRREQQAQGAAAAVPPSSNRAGEQQRQQQEGGGGANRAARGGPAGQAQLQEQAQVQVHMDGASAQAKSARYGIDWASRVPEEARQADRSDFVEATRRRLVEAAARKEVEEREKAALRYQRKEYRTGKLTEEEKARRLAEMMGNAEQHEMERHQRLESQAEKEAAEAAEQGTRHHTDTAAFLQAATKDVYGTTKGGSLEDTVGRRAYFNDRNAKG